jgi:hypothetical protein
MNILYKQYIKKNNINYNINCNYINNNYYFYYSNNNIQQKNQASSSVIQDIYIYLLL